MNENEWDRLFTLITKVVNLPGLTATEKGALVLKEAKERGCDTDLAEFVGQVMDAANE